MRHWMTAAILVLASLPAGAAEPPANQPPLTLAQAIALALTTSPRLEAAQTGISAARAQKLSARAEGQPTGQLSVSGRIQGPETSITQFQGFEPSQNNLDMPDLTKPILKKDSLNPSSTFEPSVQASQPLYTGGRVSAQKRAARRSERAALARAEAEAQRLVLDVTEAYLDTLEASQQADLSTSLRGLNEERLQVARVRLTAGAGIPLEVSQVEADFAQAVQTQIEARSRAKQAAATLNSLIGRPAASPLLLADLPATAPRQPLLVSATQPLTPERLHALGLERPDLRALREDVHRADAEIDIARAAGRPQLGLSSSYLRRIPTTLLGGFAWSLGGTLVQTLFDGGRVRAGVNAARAEKTRRAAVLAQAERQADADVERARLALEAAEQRLAAEDARVEAAGNAVAVARLGQTAGTAAPIEVTEAQTTLNRAQTAATTARFEVARARVRLAFAAGLASPESVTAQAISPPRQ